jgi:hypothetical protein
MQPFQGLLPEPLVNQIVPLRDQIIYGAASFRLAEGDSTVHAASSLSLEATFGNFGEDVPVVSDTLGSRAHRCRLSLNL